jgi:hypothetical protein
MTVPLVKLVKRKTRPGKPIGLRVIIVSQPAQTFHIISIDPGTVGRQSSRLVVRLVIYVEQIHIVPNNLFSALIIGMKELSYAWNPASPLGCRWVYEHASPVAASPRRAWDVARPKLAYPPRVWTSWYTCGQNSGRFDRGVVG